MRRADSRSKIIFCITSFAQICVLNVRGQCYLPPQTNLTDISYLVGVAPGAVLVKNVAVALCGKTGALVSSRFLICTNQQMNLVVCSWCHIKTYVSTSPKAGKNISV